MNNNHTSNDVKNKILSFLMLLMGNHLNWYVSFLGDYKSSLTPLIFNFFAPKVSIPKEDVKTIRELSRQGTVIYAGKNRSSLDFLFFHHRYKMEGLPYPIFGNFINMIWWQPVKSVFRIIISYIYCTIANVPPPNPYQTDYVRRMSEEGHSSILFLRRPSGLLKRFALTERDDPMVYLLEAQKEMTKTIYIVPQMIIFQKSPTREKKNLIDLFFGPKEDPGLIRRIVVFFRYYRRAFIKIGDPVNLREFLEERDSRADAHSSYALRRRLLDNIEAEERMIIGPVLKERTELMEMVLFDGDFQRELDDLAEVTGLPVERFRQSAVEMLSEIASDFNITYVRIFDLVLTWVWHNIYNGIEVDMEGLAKIREAGKKAPLILIPCHKSHIDYLMLSYVFLHNNLHIPHIAAGANLSFWPMGHIFRKSGAFFLRRTFKGDRLYPIVFSAYIRTILTQGFSIEFFIEGGRSRTGKLVMPKLGLLSIIINAYLNGYVDDITFVPVFIGYDRIMEESAYIKELSGEKKQKENFRAMLKGRSLLRKRYGRVYINFSEPISIKNFLTDSGYDVRTITKPEIRQLQYDLAYRIVYSINEESVVTTTNLVALAFMSHIKGALTWDELCSLVSLYTDYLDYFNARFTDTYKGRKTAIGEALTELIGERLVQLVKSDIEEEEDEEFEPLFYVPDDRRLHLEYYKNNILHFFLPAAFVSTSLLFRTPGDATEAATTVDFRYLRKIFKFEFIYDLKFSDAERVNQVLAYFEQLGVITKTNDEYEINPDKREILMAFAGLIHNYLESYLVAAQNLPEYVHKKPKSERDVMRRLDASGEKMFKRGEITRMEALSPPSYKSALTLMTHEKVLDTKTVTEGKKTVRYYSPGPEERSYREELKRFLSSISHSS
ncbi:MAG: 1-acyl-sn-glycerol-3-phosphate acyltransferase [Deltaproteobacteria bacterium]|nr:1-acyl-sn-glycerol-3-phosphate acyltransferase [Candidatus Zymogenaceae bacterium]